MNDKSASHQSAFSSDHFVNKLKVQLLDLQPRRLLVAYSGGMDSSVLLHVLAAHRNDLPASLTALHVDHGLHPESGVWRQHCEQFCTALNIPFSCRVMELDPAKGESVEALARVARYAWFAENLQQDDVLLTAHHRDDQAETVLLQLFRGAGVHGLAAMPEYMVFANGYLLRPMLEFSRDQISQYARDEELSTLDDPANADTRFRRNIVRHEVLPLIRQNWPGVDKTLLRTANHCVDAMVLLDELAQQDIEVVIDKTSAVLLSPFPPVRADLLTPLSRERIKNLLRYWIRKNGFALPSSRKLQEVMQQLVDNESNGGCVAWGEAELRRYREHLFLQCKIDIEPDFQAKNWFVAKPFELHETKVELRANLFVSQGLRRTALQNELICIRPRRGGEHIRLPNARHRTAIKKLYQARGVPPWVRERLPLLYIDDQLAAIPGITVDDAFAARTGEESIVITVETIT